MSMDRDAARALFANAEPTPLAPDGASPFAAQSPFAESDAETPLAPDGASPFAVTASPFAPTSPFAESDADLYDPVVGKTATRRKIDWRYVAPIGVAAIGAGAVLLIASQRDPAEQGKTVAAAEIVQPAPPQAIAPVETAQATTAPDSSIVEPRTARTSPVRTTVRAAPARRAQAPRVIASRPAASADDAAADASARAPYVPPPSLGVPTQVIITPPPPAPVPTPQPDPTTPQ